MSETTYYKIRKKSEPDLYLKGTPAYHSYDKSGRVFQSLGAVRTFITNVMNNEYRRSQLDDWQVVSYVMQLRDIKDIVDIVKPEKIVELLKR